MRARSLAAAVALALLPVVVPVSTGTSVGTGIAAAATKPNIFFYNLDDLRDAVPGQHRPDVGHAEDQAMDGRRGDASRSTSSPSRPAARPGRR